MNLKMVFKGFKTLALICILTIFFHFTIEPQAGGSKSFDLRGEWNSNIGVTYNITQNGYQFIWVDTKTNIKGTGKIIQGVNVSTSWTDQAGTHSAKGEITSWEGSGRANEIKWDHGVIFKRAANTPYLFIPDLKGKWNSNIGVIYDISQKGQTFKWKVPGKNDVGQGTIEGGSVSATWKGESGSGSANGTIQAIKGRAWEITWDNDVVFSRPKEKPESTNLTGTVLATVFEPGVSFAKGPLITKPGILHTPPKVNLAPIQGYKMIKKTDYMAVLEVKYSYTFPTSKNLLLYCEIYQKDGNKIGSSYNPSKSYYSLGLPKALKGTILVPVKISREKLLFKDYNNLPTNQSSEIVFFIFEEGVPKKLSKNFQFDYHWGQDIIYGYSSKDISNPSNPKSVEISVIHSIDHGHLDGWNAERESSFPNIFFYLDLEAWYKGKVVDTGSYKIDNKETYLGLQNSGDFGKRTYKVSLLKSGGRCDEIKITFRKDDHKSKRSGKTNFIMLRKTIKCNINI